MPPTPDHNAHLSQPSTAPRREPPPPLNPYASPQAMANDHLAPVEIVAGEWKSVLLGVTCINAGFKLSAAGLLLLFLLVPLQALASPLAGTFALAIVITSIITIALGSLVRYVGLWGCRRVPKGSNLAGSIHWCLLLSTLSLLLVVYSVAQVFGGPYDAAPLSTGLGFATGIAAEIFFLVFAIRLSKQLGRSDLVTLDKAIIIFVILLGVVSLGLFVIGMAISAQPSQPQAESVFTAPAPVPNNPAAPSAPLDLTTLLILGSVGLIVLVVACCYVALLHGLIKELKRRES